MTAEQEHTTMIQNMTTISYEGVPRMVMKFVGFAGHASPGRTVYDYKVLIDGEHRATFENDAVHYRTGFTLRNGTGESLGRKRHYWAITRADFDEVVRELLPKIATVAEIERVNTIAAAEKENAAWDEERACYNAEVRRQMLSEALTQYLDNAADDDEALTAYERDKLAAARTMLDQIDAHIAAAA